jgi:hypothetical protein
MTRALWTVVAAALLALPVRAETRLDWARYRISGQGATRVIQPVEGPGYRVSFRSPDGRVLEATVAIDGTPLRDEATLPVDPRFLPAEARALLATPPAPHESMDRLGSLLIRNSRTVLEAVEAVIGYTARRIKYEPPSGSVETAVQCQASGRGSCVGRSLLAADLLLRSGIPARQVSGVLIASSAADVAPAARPFFSQELGGVRHRWIEVYVPGLGWVPSDPGGLSNTVTARHFPLKAPPNQGFAIELLQKGPELMLARIDLFGQGATLGRLRATSVEVTLTQADGAVVLTPVSGSGSTETSRVGRAEGSRVRFDQVPVGDYRLIWKGADGKVEAASLRVDGPARIELPTGGGRR